MSREKINELIALIEELQALEPPGTSGDDKPPHGDVGSTAWFVRVLREDFQPSLSDHLPDSVRQAIDAAAQKQAEFEGVGMADLAKKWDEAGWAITCGAIDAYGFDAVMLDGIPDKLLPFSIKASDLREAIDDNPHFPAVSADPVELR